MKKLALIILLLAVATLAVGGCCGQQTKEANQLTLSQAWDIVRDIPLPDAGYSNTTGHKLVLSEIKIKIDGYSTDTGEPYLVATCIAKDPNPPVFRLVRSDEGKFYLMLPYGSSTFRAGGYTLYSFGICKFTLAELKEYRDELIWGNPWLR